MYMLSVYPVQLHPVQYAVGFLHSKDAKPVPSDADIACYAKIYVRVLPVDREMSRVILYLGFEDISRCRLGE